MSTIWSAKIDDYFELSKFLFQKSDIYVTFLEIDKDSGRYYLRGHRFWGIW